MNQDEGSSSARHDLGDEVMVVKPSCNYHFWCLWLEENKNFGGCIKFFWKICVRKNFFCKKLNRKFWKIQFLQKFFIKLYFSTSNINLKLFQLSFDVYIVSISENYRFSKIFVLKAENFVPSDEVTLASNFGNIMNHRMVFKDFLEG